MAWLTGWPHRKSHNLIGATGAGTDYQVSPITVHSGLLTPSPVTIGTSTVDSGWATNYPHQRKLFYMAGRLWAFYHDGTNIVYRTSADEGINWGAAITVRSAGSYFGSNIAFYFDDTYLHYAFNGGTAGALYYRMGTPETDGTITWAAVEQTVLAASGNDAYQYSSITVDSNGYPWIGYCQKPSDYPTSGCNARIIKASTNDGTWTTESGFPYTVVADATNALVTPIGVALTSGKTFWRYIHDEVDSISYLYGRLWNGSSWEDEETVTANTTGPLVHSCVADGDNVHLIYYTVTPTLRYRKRTYGVSWGDEYEVSASLDTIPALTYTASNSVMAFWGLSNHIYYRKMDSGSWASAVDWYNETDTISSSYDLNALVEDTEDLCPIILYTAKSGSPYDVRVLSAATPSGDTVYLGGKCTNFPNDIRFTDNDGETKLSHWCEDLTADPAIFHVKVTDSLESGTVPIYLYCGKSGASSESNGAATFIVFDDFERGVNGDPVGGSWTVTQGSAVISTEQKYSGTRALKITGGASYVQVHIPVTHSDNIAIRFRVHKEDAPSILWSHGDGTNLYYAQAEADEDIVCFDGVGWIDTGANIVADIWQLIESNNFVWATPTVDIWLNGAKIKDNADISFVNASFTNQLYFQGVTTVGQDTYIDNVIARKWVATEPTHGAWGEWEEEEVALQLSITDSVLVGDSSLRSMLIGLSITDGFESGDTNSPFGMLSKLDGLKAGDSPSLLASLLVGDGLKLGDTPLYNLLWFLAIAEEIKFSDSNLLNFIIPLIVTDGTKLGDSLSILTKLAISDGLELGDSPSRETIANLLRADGVELGDTATLVGALLYLAIVEGLKPGDTRLIGMQADIQASDGTKIGDSPLAGMLASLLSTDGLKAGDSVSRLVSMLLVATDGVKAGDAQLAEMIADILRADGVALGDITIAGLTGIIYLTLIEAIKLGDARAIGGLGRLLRMWLRTQPYFDVTMEVKPYYDVSVETSLEEE